MKKDELYRALRELLPQSKVMFDSEQRTDKKEVWQSTKSVKVPDASWGDGFDRVVIEDCGAYEEINFTSYRQTRPTTLIQDKATIRYFREKQTITCIWSTHGGAGYCDKWIDSISPMDYDSAIKDFRQII